MENRVKETFGKIHTEEALLYSTKKFLYEKMEKGARRRVQKNHFIPVVSCFILLFLFSAGYQICFATTTVISVDVNPSIELNVNRLDRVIEVKSYNEEGEDLAGALKVKYMNYTDALEAILDSEKLQKYLSTEEDMISIAVIAEDEKKGEKVLTEVQTCTGNNSNTYCYQADQEEVDAAHEAGLSYGKYRAFLILQELDPNITTDDVKGMTMREIRDWIADLSGEEEVIKGNGEGQGMGTGCQNGKKMRKRQSGNKK